MLKLSKKTIISCLLSLFGALAFTLIDWSVDGFDFLKTQNYKFYFQSWVSVAGLIFTTVMAITTFIVYKKSQLHSLKFIVLSFLLTALAFGSIGYHTSYCKVCSDLAMCGASHNYPNYLTVIALIVSVVTALLMNLKNNITVLKLFAYGLILASLLLVIILFISIQFMEIPDVIAYVISTINLQGFVFIFPLALIVLSFVYFRKQYIVPTVILFVFALLFISFLPQAYHLFVCTECHTMECSEFFVFSGLLMFAAVGSLIYSIGLQLEERSRIKP